MPLHITYIVGSPSADSINRNLVDAVIGLERELELGEERRLEFAEIPIDVLPLYNRDMDGSYPPEATQLKEAIRGSDGLLIATKAGLTRTAPGVTLTVHPFDAPRETHRFGFEQPAAGTEQIAAGDIDVVLVPGLAFSSDGRRLGRGAGYYDRFLAGVDADKVALTTSDRIRDDLPREAHDVLMDWLATEDGVKAVTPADPPE